MFAKASIVKKFRSNRCLLKLLTKITLMGMVGSVHHRIGKTEKESPPATMQTPPISQKPTLRDWLLSATSESRFQARAGRAYIGWTAFTENRLAMIGLVIILGLLLAAALAPALAPFPPNAADLSARLAPPMIDGHPLGTDELGRDILSRILHGSRLTLYVVVLVAVIAAPTGLVIGDISGFAGGVIDMVLMRITDIFLAFPKLILALAFVSALGRASKTRDRHRRDRLAALLEAPPDAGCGNSVVFENQNVGFVHDGDPQSIWRCFAGRSDGVNPSTYGSCIPRQPRISN